MLEKKSFDPEKWIDNYGDELYSYACSRMKDTSVAQDIVQETFLSAWKSKDSFNGIYSERNWLYAICKNKLIDHFRKSVRSVSTVDIEFEDVYFNKKEHWVKTKSPKTWTQDPSSKVENDEFYKILELCQNKLKDQQRNVFILKYMEDMDTEEICEKLEITQSNFRVLIHRSKLQLRACLEMNWFK